MCVCVCVCVLSSPTDFQGEPKATFSIATTPRCRELLYSFPWITTLTLDPYTIMLRVKHADIKYHFLSHWYVSTED